MNHVIPLDIMRTSHLQDVIRNALYLVVIRSTLYAWDYDCEYFIYDRLLLTMHATCKIIQVPNKRYQLLDNCNIRY